MLLDPYKRLMSALAHHFLFLHLLIHPAFHCLLPNTYKTRLMVIRSTHADPPINFTFLPHGPCFLSPLPSSPIYCSIFKGISGHFNRNKFSTISKSQGCLKVILILLLHLILAKRWRSQKVVSCSLAVLMMRGSCWGLCRNLQGLLPVSSRPQ